MLPDFDEVWCVDFEFRQQTGERPSPVCLVAREFRTSKLVRVGWEDLLRLRVPPFRVDAGSLFVAYFASAEFGCFLALSWPMPLRVLDLFVEFRCRRSGLPTPGGRGILGALSAHGLDAMQAVEKKAMRELVMREGPHSAEERVALLDYCQTDVDALVRLLPAMLPNIDLPRALLRGRYMAAVARMEWAGTPIDTERLALFRRKWDGIKRQVVARIDRAYGVYDGVRFKTKNWMAWLELNDLPWPTLPTGYPMLDEETFRDMAQLYPVAIGPIRELRVALSQMKLQSLAVGADGRNRAMLSAFSSKTGRNQPSNSKFIFGPSTWLRSLIRPEPGRAVAYIDWSQQELAIAAALSGDRRMQDAYLSGDFYLAFGKMAGVIPADATKESHESARDQFKTVALGVLYGLSEWGLARKLSVPAWGRDLLRMHREAFRQFWRWSDDVQDHAMLSGHMRTAFGWPVHLDRSANPRSLRNFPMQANGAEMLRLACCEATERGITVCCPVHDAVLVESPEADIEATVADMQGIMVRAGEVVLNGFRLRSDAKIVRYPDRYRDRRGAGMWQLVCELCGVPI